MLKIEDVARVCHEVNRAYCRAENDFSQVPWDEAPQWQRESAIAGVQTAIDNPAATPESLHQSWMTHKRADGWILGPTKDAEAKTHPCLLPYEELPRAQRTKDYLFLAVVNALRSLL